MKEFEQKVAEFLKTYRFLIKDIVYEVGSDREWFYDVLYDQDEFTEFVKSVNTGTEDEMYFADGWTDDKDEMFHDMCEAVRTDLLEKLREFWSTE